MSLSSHGRVCLLALCLAVSGGLACGATSPVVRAWEDTMQDGGIGACDAPSSDRCVVLACDEGECGLFACEDVDEAAVAQASPEHRVEQVRGRPSFRAPGTYRGWWQRRTGVRGGALPLATAPVPLRRAGFVPAMPSGQGRLIKHHLFPQEPRLAAYFRTAGVDIHEFTMVIPEYIHRQIHSGKGMGPGGAWNHAWHQFMKAYPRPPARDVLMRHAIELAFRFQLSGPIVPYNTPVVPRGAGPRIEAY